MIELGVNIDHIATLREARKGRVPDVLMAAKICELNGAHQITVHLRQDRRHIQDHDVELLAQALLVRMNLEMAPVDEMVHIAQRVRPYSVCLVPENREEVTTEGGLDVAAARERCADIVAAMHEFGIQVSMFIDPEPEQIEASAAINADMVELHTGAYANATGVEQDRELERLFACAEQVEGTTLRLNAGHGLTVRNLSPVCELPGLREVNIGHDIVARAVFIGLDNAVREILDVLDVYGEED